MEEVSNLIIQKLETMATDRGLINSKRKAIIVLFLYAVRLGRSGNHRIVDVSLRAAMALSSEELIWRRAKPLIMKLSNTQGPPSLNWLIALAPPHVSRPPSGHTSIEPAVALVLTFVAELYRSFFDIMFHVMSIHPARRFISVETWRQVENELFPPPECSGQSRVSSGDVVRRVRALGDIEIVKSYLLLIWSEWDHIDDQQSGGLAEMEVSIREDFGGIEMWRHRQDLIKRLDRVLGQLDRGLDHLKQHKPSLDTDHIPRAKAQYNVLKEVLLEVEAEAEADIEVMVYRGRKSLRLIILGPLTPTDTHRISLDFRMCSASTLICSEHMPLFRSSTWFV